MNVTALSLPASKQLGRRIGWVLLLLSAIGAAANAVMFMVVEDYGNPGIRNRFIATSLAGWAHTLGGAVAVLIGPFQLLTWLRAQRPKLHVWMGRIYLGAVLAGALGGLYFAPSSLAGTVGTLGFGMLALAWLYTGAQAFIAIRRGQVQAHRRWMIRNYALTFAAVTLRIELPLLMVGAGLTFDTALKVVAWSCWVPNWLIVESWLRAARPALAVEPARP